MREQSHPLNASPNLLPFLRPATPAPHPGHLVRPALVQDLVHDEGHTPARISASASLAHDIRNALCSLQMLSGLLAEPGVLVQSRAHFAADLATVTGTLTTLVNRLTGAAGGEQQLPPASRGPQGAARKSAGDALAAGSSLLRAIAGPGVAVHVSAESGLPPLALDEESLSRVLMNLVKNAREAMPEGGVVHITARRALSRDYPAVLLHVSDNGPGIPSHALSQIFEPGWTSKRPGGVECGLGLAIVRELVEACGGEIRVASTPRRGTTFELRLPCLLETKPGPVLP